MAVAVQNTNSYDSGVTSSTAHSFTISSSGTDRLLIVGVNSYTGAAVTGITYDGVAMTLVDSDSYTYIYKLANPNVGTNLTVTITLASSMMAAACAIQVTGASSVGTAVHSAGTGTTMSLDVTSATDDLVIDVWGTGYNTARTFTVGAGQTTVANIYTLRAGSDYMGLQSSYEAGAATVTMNWTPSGTVNYNGMGVNIVQSVAPATGNFFQFFGPQPQV